jgi:hypothetical protein
MFYHAMMEGVGVAYQILGEWMMVDLRAIGWNWKAFGHYWSQGRLLAAFRLCGS